RDPRPQIFCPYSIYNPHPDQRSKTKIEHEEPLTPDAESQQRPVAVRRSELVCPAHSLKMMAKAAAGDADEVIFDLEDGCAPSQKVAARKTLVEAFRTLDFGGKVCRFSAPRLPTEVFFSHVICLSGPPLDR